MQMLNRILIKECPLKCGKEKLTYEELINEHLLKKCPKIKVACKYDGCRQEVLREQIEMHVT